MGEPERAVLDFGACGAGEAPDHDLSRGPPLERGVEGTRPEVGQRVGDPDEHRRHVANASAGAGAGPDHEVGEDRGPAPERTTPRGRKGQHDRGAGDEAVLLRPREERGGGGPVRLPHPPPSPPAESRPVLAKEERRQGHGRPGPEPSHPALPGGGAHTASSPPRSNAQPDQASPPSCSTMIPAQPGASPLPP